ncbi:MAG: HNH endonuclease [Eubacteriales bacterium]|nr:HNH endonuclease [Eubacteriales bacterium]
MLRSCPYCGRIHDTREVCGQKLAHQRQRYRCSNPEARTEEQRFRSSQAWRRKSEEIRERDRYVCQACIRNLNGTRRRLEYENISVHHAVPLHVDYSRRLDNDNLITLCSVHHELAERGELSLEVVQGVIAEQEEKISPLAML